MFYHFTRFILRIVLSARSCAFCLLASADMNGLAANADDARQAVQVSGFSYPLEPAGTIDSSPIEKAALQDALAGATNVAEVLEQFVANHPTSPYVPSVRAQLAHGYRQQGRMTPALAHWETAWNNAKNSQDAGGRRVADFTLAHYTQLLAALGRVDELGAILMETRDRAIAVSGRRLQYLLESSREAWIVMRNHPGIAFRCGTLALREVGRRLKSEAAAPLTWLLEAPSPKGGFSLAHLEELGRQHALGLVAVRREANEELIVPSVLHWSQNHYAAIVEQNGDLFRVIDPTFVSDIWLTREVIDQEASGNFLAPESKLPGGWRKLTAEESEKVFGRGYVNNLRDSQDEGCPKTPGKTPCPPCKEAKGMPTWWVSEPYANLWLADEPLEYTTSRGERMAFRLTFKQRDTIPDGPAEMIPPTGWNHNWFSYLRWDERTDAPGSPLGYLTLYAPGGGERAYRLSYWGYAFSTYYNNYHEETRSKLETMRGLSIGPSFSGQSPWLYAPFLEGHTGFQTTYPDGSQDWYGRMVVLGVDGTIQHSAALLTHQIDRFGNTNRFYYEDATNGTVPTIRLAQVVDYDGRTNFLRYTTNHLLREVENPYGQKAHFYYDTNGFLTNIVDMAGLSSRMTYDTNGWVTSLITPYGTNTFIHTVATLDTNLGNAGGHTVNRAVQSIAADGAKEMTLYRYDCEAFIDPTIPSNQMPQNTPLGTLDDGNGGTNQFKAVSYRNSFYWNSKQVPALSDFAWASRCLRSATTIASLV
jgi:hypothetical protein